MSMLNLVDRPQLITKPMKAPNDDQSIQSLFYQLPCFVSPKIDAFRCVKETGVGAVTSSMKPQPNLHVRKMLSGLPSGLDGELGDTNFRTTMSTIKRSWGSPDFRWYLFDYVSRDLRTPADERIQELSELQLPDWCIVLPQVLVSTTEELQYWIAKWTTEGFMGVPLDGAMLRGMKSPYKCNRATLNEAYLLKDKPYVDAEALVTGIYEEEENTNEAFINHSGGTSRSSHAAGKVGKGVLGGVISEVINGRYVGLEIHLGSGQGWTDDWKARAYRDPSIIVGKTITFKYLDKGDYDLPRNASMKCIREEWDL
jgi:hypothetical protein